MINEALLLILVSAPSQPATPVAFERINAQTRDQRAHRAYALERNAFTMIAK
jgi:hypothetical protein